MLNPKSHPKKVIIWQIIGVRFLSAKNLKSRKVTIMMRIASIEGISQGLCPILFISNADKINNVTS
jgi:hypothetical protein